MMALMFIMALMAAGNKDFLNCGVPINAVSCSARAHSATKFGKMQLFCQMTLGTFPSMPPTGKSCWDCLYLNAGHFKSGTQKPHFFTAFWHREDQTIIYCSQTN